MLWNNLKITIQHPADSIRRGKDAVGKQWSQRMPYDYGEIIGTEGIDKEPVDVIVGSYLKSKTVFVCQMPKNKSGEDKVMIGFLTAKQAKKAFIACYGGDVSFFGKMKAMSLKMLKLLLSRTAGKSLIASFYDGTYMTHLSTLEPVPTGWNTKVDNPGDKKLDKEAKKLNIEIARRQGPDKVYVQTHQVADTTSHVDGIYS